MNTDLCDWAMLAKEFEKQKYIQMPCIIQPKLNGIRVKWDCNIKRFVTRQGEIVSKDIIPHLYAAYHNSACSLDGELYCHGMAFQDIYARVAIGRIRAHLDVNKIQFHVFDIISQDLTEQRIAQTAVYGMVPCLKIFSLEELYFHHTIWVAQGFEGTMVRRLGQPYIIGRTDALLKLKNKHEMTVTIVGFQEGEGKFKGKVGAILVSTGKHRFKLGGGKITEDQREMLWKDQPNWLNRQIIIEYCETSMSGKPLKAQVKCLHIPIA